MRVKHSLRRIVRSAI